MTGFVRKLTGAKDQKQAARDAANAQVESSQAALDQAERLSAPYRGLGESAIPQFQQFIDDPTGYSYLQNNPMFDAALKYSGDQLKSASASRGKFNSGGLVEQLFQNYIATGNDVVNQGYNRLMNPIKIGQAAAAGQAANASELLTGMGNARAAGAIGAANAQAAGTKQAIDLGLNIAGFFAAMSDERVKNNMFKVGEDSEGNNLYEFEYKNTAPRYIGYSAQEIAKKDPQNVLLGGDGLLRVSEKYMPKRIS